MTRSFALEEGEFELATYVQTFPLTKRTEHRTMRRDMGMALKCERNTIYRMKIVPLTS